MKKFDSDESRDDAEDLPHEKPQAIEKKTSDADKKKDKAGDQEQPFFTTNKICICSNQSCGVAKCNKDKFFAEK
jgi:hypothetical protein